MNKAITDGIVFQPLPFSAGLGVWASGDGTPGSDTYAVSGTGAFVAADQDFGGCLEVLKTQNTQMVRYMGETPILPGCYLRITARVKAVAGPLPTVRISGWAGRANGSPAVVAKDRGPATTLATYGEVVTVTAIVGTGRRDGVDLVWPDVAYGHFGIDLTGPSGGLVRVDDIQIDDVSSVFLSDLVAAVDVRDFGAIGDGVTDDSAAFEAADAAANGRTIHVPRGNFRLGGDVTIENHIRFEGRISQAQQHSLILQSDYKYQTYLDAFKDEELAFKKAYQALLNFADHESLDLNGRRIKLTAPVDMQACDPGRDVFAQRRVIRNGQFEPEPGPAWDTQMVTSRATYSRNDALELTNVVNVANIAVGSLVSGAGVGREVYVQSRNIDARSLTISAPLYDAAGTQNFTFERFAYLLDFSGYKSLSAFVIDDVDFLCSGEASGVMLAQDGLIFHARDCFFTKPKDRGLTSPGRACQGMMIDRCQFLSNEQPLLVQDRSTIAFNANANDVKIRNNRAVKFKHFCVLAGGGSLISGNHWFNGDTATNGVRRGGLIFTATNCRANVTGNYSDNNFIEWTNEHDPYPRFDTEFSFGGLTITGNNFVSTNVGAGFSFLVIKPYGPGHFIHGLSVTGNVFRTINGTINRIEDIDTSFADLDFSRMRNVTFTGNVFHGINQEIFNPVLLEHNQSSTDATWTADTQNYLPFRAPARSVDSFCAVGAIRRGNNVAHFQMPFVTPQVGSGGRSVRFTFDEPVKGRIRYQARMDNPL